MVNRFLHAGRVVCLVLLLLVCCSVAALAQVNVYMRSYDTSRTTANLQETILTPQNVNPTNFGKLFTVHTDGEIYTQPLYVSNLAIAGGTHNVVFVGTTFNTVYAIDADNGTVYWTQNFGYPIIAQDVQNDWNISWYTGIGIIGTPVIDPDTNILYVVNGHQPQSGQQSFTYYLNAIDITTGNPVNGSPKQISASYSTPDLTSPEVFQAKTQNQRCGLTLANGNIYMCFGSHQDIMPYTGWMMAYNKSTLNQVAVYAVTTIGSEGGIWMAGQAPVVDSSGNLYVSTGNGTSGTTPNGLYQAGESIIKLSPSLQLLDYFTPYNAASLSAGDMDLASAGVIMVPNTNYLLGGGKQGVLYLVNTGDMGHFNASHDNVQQEFQAIFGQGTSHIHGTASYFDSDAHGPTVYIWGENDVLRSFTYNSGSINTNPWATSSMTAPVTNNDGAMPGGFTSISANGNSNGILWASTPYNGNAAGNSNPEFAGDGMVQGVLYAFNADTLQLLWSDKLNDGRDEIGLFAKYLPPMVANGKMYVPNFGTPGTTDGSGNLVVYGLFNPPTTNPTLTVSANNATRAYGATNPTFSGTVTGAQNGDTFTESFTTTATTTSAVGQYPIVPSASGKNLGNYTVDIVNGTLTVTGAPTTTTLTAPATSTYGTSVTLTATVTSADGTPGGSVNFLSGTTLLGTGTLNASGVATLSTTTIPGGTDSLTAAYPATGNFGTSTSAVSSITVSKATQTITFPPIASRPYGSAPFAVTATSSAGSNYPVTITVQSGPATIGGGTVTLTGAGTVALQATQAGDANYSAATAVVQSFQVTPAPLTVAANNATRVFGAANPTFTGTVTGAVNGDTFTESFTTTATTTSAVGSYPIVPAVTGANLASYTVNIVNGALSVTGASTTTTLSAPGTAAYGASVALTATVASTSGTPSGVVTFYSGATALGTGTLNNGVATLTTTTLPVGTDSLTASYAATGNFGASTSAASSIKVTAATQTITFAPIASRAYGSAPFAVTATSSLGSSYPVTITVQSGPAVINGGVLTITGAGTVVLQAAQAGNANYGAATATDSFQVTPAPLTVKASNATRTFGTANPAFSGTIAGAVGSDSFSESFTTSATTTSNVGSYPIVPAVTGAQLANYTVTIVNGALTVTGVATTTTLTAPGSSNAGASVTLTATVTSASGTPGGTVTFLSGSTPIGTSALNGSGVATLSTASLPAGSDPVTASYAASGNFAGSASPATIVTVKGESQTITFPPIASRPYGSAPFAVTATSSLGSSYPVTISVASGPATISGGMVTVTGVGTVVLQATQAGGGNYDPATATQSFQVTAAATTTSLNAPASAAYGASVTLTATVASTAGTPAGSVTFYNGSTSLGVGTLSGSGVATLTTTALPAGTDTATASYAAAGNFAGSSSTAVTLTVGAAPVEPVGTYAVSANPTTLTIAAGGKGNTTLTFSPTNGYSGTISLSCLNLPANATCAFANSQVTLSGKNQSVNTGLTINTTMQSGKNAPSGTPQSPFSPALFALVFWCPGGLTGLAVLARRRKLAKTKRLWHLCLLLAGAWVFAVGLSGCGMHGFVANVTPGTSQVTVVATGTSGSVVTTQTVTLTINMTTVTQ